MGASRDSQSFKVSECLLFENGDNVILRDDLGFTIGSPLGDVREGLTLEDLETATLTVVGPQDPASPDAHPWAALALLARRRRITIGAHELAELPYLVKLTDQVKDWLLAPA